VGFFIGVVVGWAIAASLFAAIRLLRPPRVISSEVRAMQTALHAANGMLPDLRRGLSEDSAKKVTEHLRTLTCWPSRASATITITPVTS
jgi:two-component system LytT family sensor kinase